MVDPEKQILDGGRVAAKTFAYSDQDPNKPAQWWFQDAPEGLVLFVVLYTQACRWNRCTGCNLPSMSSLGAPNLREIVTQIDTLLAIPEVAERLPQLQKLILSNKLAASQKNPKQSKVTIAPRPQAKSSSKPNWQDSKNAEPNSKPSKSRRSRTKVAKSAWSTPTAACSRKAARASSDTTCR